MAEAASITLLSIAMHNGRTTAASGAGWPMRPSSASDFICGALQFAAGMNLHVFTTGHGTPHGLVQAPVTRNIAS